MSYLILFLACILLVDAVPLVLDGPITNTSRFKAPLVNASPVKALPVVAKTSSKAVNVVVPSVKATLTSVARISTTTPTPVALSIKSAPSIFSASITSALVVGTSTTSATTSSGVVSSSVVSSAPSLGSSSAVPISSGPEFIGWHGTNSITSNFWAGRRGTISKPPPPNAGIFDSFTFDFFGQTRKQADLTSGADEELGTGLYVTDDLDIARGFANGNTNINRLKDPSFAGTPKVCQIFAKDSANWRTAVTKAFIPRNLIRDDGTATQKKAFEDARLDHIVRVLNAAYRGVQNAQRVVKFGVLDPSRPSSKANQLMIPSAITELFSATCFDPADVPSKPPDFDEYTTSAQRTNWCIVSETGVDPCRDSTKKCKGASCPTGA
ncbi:hypothetical protein PUNSTDRAFT_134050 [Punctularia strigosozonata HHB-11173 SS5]|uniref:uncharacterized protein n=1 Tax=Punctularia strigosozonata (strain HHB-11173) TaxID=741275 RepID=UPI0004417E8A|nr:uncharacterized protein PUNSTDRAFT_134050 [Punctularia strigosozonata HHB-11173 SS5]EIN08875.1 hypothetical protein PUNSTDRAFT_134050 [Punctularia strigosozonata HHB-11173 SS5]